MPFLFYYSSLVGEITDFEKYMVKRDPVLGWPSPSAFGKDPFDASGSRVIPAFSTPGNACASLYGDSFAWGEEVDHAHAWSNVLSVLLGCRVANYGVGGYGTDQAYLRFVSNQKDEARVVVLVIYPYDFQRNVNQYRPLVVGIHKGNIYGFKPRFVLNDSEELNLVPIPSPSKTEFVNCVRDPATYLKHEYFLPGTKAGPISFEFPYTLFLFKALQQEEVQASLLALLNGVPTWAGYSSPGHPSESFEITVAIGKAFGHEARKRGKIPLVVFLPTPSAVEYFKRRNIWVYQEMADSIAREGIRVIDAGPYMLKKLVDRSFCSLLTEPEQCIGHFNVEGNKLLADLMYETISQSGFTAGVASVTRQMAGE
jgi:hypothetical protein